MEISNNVKQNRQELSALKSSQKSSLASINKFVTTATYTISGRGSGVFGKAGRVVFVFFNTNFRSQPLAIMNLKVLSDSRRSIVGENYGFWKTILNEQVISQSVGQAGWRITTPWIDYDDTTTAELTIEFQVISNLSGTIQIIDGGYRWL